MDFLSFFALGVLILVILIQAYEMIAIHDIPYQMAKKRAQADCQRGDFPSAIQAG
ncbi:MAG: DUF3302 domain-containing protein [Terrimicrobiaceae bacterium]|nr:DUF3302 domain-containing protein [Terrimicrobiaceae bacterium]